MQKSKTLNAKVFVGINKSWKNSRAQIIKKCRCSICFSKRRRGQPKQRPFPAWSENPAFPACVDSETIPEVSESSVRGVMLIPDSHDAFPLGVEKEQVCLPKKQDDVLIKTKKWTGWPTSLEPQHTRNELACTGLMKCYVAMMHVKCV